MNNPVLLLACAALVIGGLSASCKGKAKTTGEPAVEEKAAEADEAKEDKKEAAADESAEEKKDEPAKPDLPVMGFSKLGADDDSDAAGLNKEGLSMLKKKKLDRARELFEQVLEADPEHSTAAYNLACVLAQQGENGPAAQMLARALQLNLPRWAGKMEKDKDLKKLQAAPEWQTVLGSKEEYAAALKEAVTMPGAFVLFGRKTRVGDPGFKDFDYSRGELYFFHFASRRFIPVTAERDTAGFYLDRENKKVWTIHWKDIGEETDIIPIMYEDMHLRVLELETLKTSKIKASGQAAAVFYMVENKPFFKTIEFDEAEFTETWISGEVSGEKLTNVTRKKTPVTPNTMDEVQAGESFSKNFCIKRYKKAEIPEGANPLRIDYYCAEEFPESPKKSTGMKVPGCVDMDADTKLCRMTRDVRANDDLVLVDKDGKETVLVRQKTVLQLDVL
ncbi:MAG: tetratricopeptide repeat protein [Pseudomonadota bacterium]